MKLTMPCYMSGDAAECKKANADLLPAILDFKLNKGSKFITGDKLSWLDFYFVEVVCMSEFVDPTLMETFAKLKAYREAVFELPGVKEYLSNPACVEPKYTFNNKVAKINNQIA